MKTTLARGAPWPVYHAPIKAATPSQQTTLTLLRQKPMCVSEVADARAMSWQATSKQLRGMRSVGLVASRMEPVFGERLQVVYFIQEHT